MIARETIFISAIVLTIFALLDCTKGRPMWLVLAVLLTQLATHIMMTAGYFRKREYKCNPANGPWLCNAIALLFGLCIIWQFGWAIQRGQCNRSLAAFGLLVGLYSVVSHVVHIPLERHLRDPTGHAIALVVIVVLAVAIVANAPRAWLNLQFHGSIALHERRLRDRLDHLLSALPDGSLILDAGAWLGDHTVPLAVRHKRLRFAALEPDERHHRFLVSKVRALSNVHTARLALGYEDGMCAHTGGTGPAMRFRAALSGNVQMRSIDSLVRSNEMGGTPALIHLDVEGHELDALHGAARTLARAKPILAVETLGCNELRNIESFLKQVWPDGYRLETLGETCSFGDITDRRKCRNHLFFPQPAL